MEIERRRFLLLSAVLCWLFHSMFAGELPTVDSPPFIFPDGYNASLNGEAVDFTCSAPSVTTDVTLLFNGKPASEIGPENLTAQGITYIHELVLQNDRKLLVISISPLFANEVITLECIAWLNFDPFRLISPAVLFRVQGECRLIATLRFHFFFIFQFPSLYIL